MLGLLLGCSLYLMNQIYMEQTWQIYDHALRFHIRAASDRGEDQAFKLEVRDQVLHILDPYIKNAENARETEQVVWNHEDEIKEAIEKIKEKHPSQSGNQISIYSVKERFPIRKYGKAVFPAGNYNAIRIDIGEGKGHNWWCAFYPRLCFYEEEEMGEEEEEKELGECVGTKEKKAMMGEKMKIKFLFWEWIIHEK